MRTVPVPMLHAPRFPVKSRSEKLLVRDSICKIDIPLPLNQSAGQPRGHFLSALYVP
jgi:hypothetical protein